MALSSTVVISPLLRFPLPLHPTSNRATPLSRWRRRLSPLRLRSSTVVSAAQSNFIKVIQTVWRVGKDGIEAGTNLVPEVVPKPVVRICVAGVAVTVALFLLKSFISTAFFILGVMGLSYFIFIAINKDEGPRGGGGSGTYTEEESLEEARRIMEKYK